MKSISKMLIIGVMIVSAVVPFSASATVSESNAEQIARLQKLLLQLQEQLASLKQNVVSTQKPYLTYERKSGFVDENTNKYGMTFRYQDRTPCTSMLPEYKLSFGDGKSVKADCRGVVDHVYEKNGTYTVKYSKSGKVIVTTKVTVSNASQAENTKPSALYSSPDVKATMNVVSTGDRSIKVTGLITPPSNCTGTEQMEVELLFSEQNKLSYLLSSCKPREINMSSVYDSSSDLFFPEIRVRWLNAKNNTWTYTQLMRYKVDYTRSDTSPQITKLTGGIKG